MVRYRFHLLGTILLERDGRRIIFPRKKCMALLSYIALEGRTTRAALATLLWPEKDERSAAGNLRTVLYAIRSAVGEPVLLYDHEVVGMADRTE